MKDLGITQDQFLLAMKLGLDSKDKKYFEQILTLDNFVVFRKIMETRNYQLEEEAYKYIYYSN